MKKNKIIIFYSVCLVLLTQNPSHAYIDPGAGSMFFSIVIGIMTTIFFVLSSLLLKLKTLFFRKKDLYKNNTPFVIYSEGKHYFNVFKPILDEFELRNIQVEFLTSSEDDLFFKQNYKYITGKYIGKGIEAFTKLAFLKADICLMTTPQLDVLQLKRSKNVKHYSHIFHSVATSLTYRLFSLDYFDSVLCNGEFQIPITREIEKKRNLPQKEMIVVGCTYLDVLKSKIHNFIEQTNNFTILLAPSWGESGLLMKYGEKLIDNLVNSEFKIIIRPHPQSMISEKDVIINLQNKYKENKNVFWDFSDENLNALSQANILISDFSGIIFDYAFLFNRPVLYINKDVNKQIYDFSDLDDEPWCYKEIKKIGFELKEEDFKNIQTIIKNLSTNEDICKSIERAKNEAWQNQGNSGKAIVDFLIKKQEESSKC